MLLHPLAELPQGGETLHTAFITIAAAVFTPSSDPLSMLALAGPLVAFYFLAIGVGKLLHK